MKSFISVILLFTLSLSNCGFLKNLKEFNQSPLSSDSSNIINTIDSDFFSNSLIPGKDSTDKLKKIIEALIEKLDDIGMKKNNQPEFKNFEIKMPEKGKEIRIKHGLDVTKIINVNVIIINGNNSNTILRSQVDLMSQKALYNWYVDKENFVLIRPNNLEVKDNLFLDNSRLRIVFMYNID